MQRSTGPLTCWLAAATWLALAPPLSADMPAAEQQTAEQQAAEQQAAEQGAAAPAVEKKLVRLAVYPPEVHLSTAADYQSLIAVGMRDDDVTVDLTDRVQWSLADPGLARLEGRTLYPLADGTTQLTASCEGFTVEVPVTVTQAAAPRPISFKLDVMPVFMRAGCNTGSCHGAASGKDGFRLSLFGFDPEGDHFRLTRDIGFRRINLATPGKSLLIEKSVGAVPHTGGKRFAVDSPYCQTLLGWLEAGAPLDQGEVAKVTAVEIYPPSAVLEGEGATQQMTARAKYSDGTDRDVTSLAVFLSSNDNSAVIDDSGRITAGARGEAFVMARFETHTVGSQVLALPADLQYTPPSEPPANYIDELVNAKLQKLRLEPSQRSSDEVFLRRVTLDICGLVPSPEEYQDFLADTAPDKRSRAIDRLLERKEFSEIWAMKWAELLMIRSSQAVSYKSMFLFSNWLTEQISNDVPLDQMVRELIGARGGTFKNPATNFYQIESDTLKLAENVAQVFMGIRTQCAQCHNHPFDRWTMDDYYSFASFFAQVGRKTGEDYRETVVFNSGSGNVNHLVGGRPMPPKFLGGPVPDVEGKDRRVVLAEWLTSAENPFFATSVANRVWSHFFGVGIVEPVDDIRVSNPASNPELFAALGARLVEYRYDFKQLVRDICNSQAYQRASQPNASNATDLLNFSHARIRRIRSENLLDVISQVTDTKDKFQGLPLGARAVQIADGGTSTYFLTTFGRAPRTTVCSCDVKTEPTLSQALHLLNGETVEQKIKQGGVVKRLLDEGRTPEQVVEALYIRVLCRPPTSDETAALAAVVAEDGEPVRALEDVFWALLNSREFLFNH